MSPEQAGALIYALGVIAHAATCPELIRTGPRAQQLQHLQQQNPTAYRIALAILVLAWPVTLIVAIIGLASSRSTS
ncbi:hypothetical protein [Streptomyces sp. NPDC055105]|uniref:hypothetical protein n=1 Tax=Streptomyces sp. NPDC055105 TaxID=3365719 RepID=UPI0037D67B8C